MRLGIAGRCRTPSAETSSTRSKSAPRRSTSAAPAKTMVEAGPAWLNLRQLAREDDGVVGALAYVFELEDWSCWWDRQIRLGEDFRDVVADQIDSAAAVVVVWSPAARVSTWVKWEVERARNEGKLVELALAWPGAGAGEVVDGTLVISHRRHVPPIRDAVLARVEMSAVCAAAVTAGTHGCARRRGETGRQGGRSSPGRWSHRKRRTLHRPTRAMGRYRQGRVPDHNREPLDVRP